jgi:predicted ATP-grasp superfamily ATP-dependent carboligase
MASSGQVNSPSGTDGLSAGRPAAVILGGEANALSVSRSLARLGARVYALNEPAACARYSRTCRWVPLPATEGAEDAWARFLLGAESDYLKGAVVLACSDAGIQVLARHREALLTRYRLDDCNVPAQLDMLDKLATYRHALAAGVATPRFWVAESREQLLSVRQELVYPLIVKPRVAHRAGKHFNSKHTFATNFDQVLAACEAERAAAVDVLLMEWVPGGDDHLCSYYTYLDEAGNHLFQFTKRVIRRYPTGMGPATYHITDWVPQIVEPAKALFKQAGLRGLANVEFKRDPRDGKYKIIECNARFTASNCLVESSGFDLAAFVYRRIVGLPQLNLAEYKLGLRLWDPVVDTLSFLELRRLGEMSLSGWARSLMHRQTFPYFRWSDPLPALVRGRKMLRALTRPKGPAALAPGDQVVTPAQALINVGPPLPPSQPPGVPAVEPTRARLTATGN